MKLHTYWQIKSSALLATTAKWGMEDFDLKWNILHICFYHMRLSDLQYRISTGIWQKRIPLNPQETLMHSVYSSLFFPVCLISGTRNSSFPLYIHILLYCITCMLQFQIFAKFYDHIMRFNLTKCEVAVQYRSHQNWIQS